MKRIKMGGDHAKTNAKKTTTLTANKGDEEQEEEEKEKEKEESTACLHSLTIETQMQSLDTILLDCW